MYFKKSWGSMVEKEPPLGRIDMFQTSPNSRRTVPFCPLSFTNF